MTSIQIEINYDELDPEAIKARKKLLASFVTVLVTKMNDVFGNMATDASVSVFHTEKEDLT